MTQTSNGACQCGAVGFLVTGTFESFFLRHCARCRKDTGGARGKLVFFDMTDVKTPAKLPDGSHHVIVKLETIHVPATELDTTPFSHEQITYEYTPPGDTTLIAERVRNASIVATTTVPINANTLGDAPFLWVPLAKPSYQQVSC